MDIVPVVVVGKAVGRLLHVEDSLDTVAPAQVAEKHFLVVDSLDTVDADQVAHRLVELDTGILEITERVVAEHIALELLVDLHSHPPDNPIRIQPQSPL